MYDENYECRNKWLNGPVDELEDFGETIGCCCCGCFIMLMVVFAIIGIIFVIVKIT